MYLVLGNKNKIIFKGNDEVFYIEDICSIKQFKGCYDLILVDININDDGIVNNEFFFEELLITLQINRIITNSPSDKLFEICEYHQKDLIILQ